MRCSQSEAGSGRKSPLGGRGAGNAEVEAELSRARERVRELEAHLDEVEEQLRVSEGKVRGIAEAMVTGVTL